MQIKMHAYVNRNPYRMHDPKSNTYFEPGVPTLAQETDWLAKQAHIEQLADDSPAALSLRVQQESTAAVEDATKAAEKADAEAKTAPKSNRPTIKVK